ncbi:organ-specific protein P4-like [Humulus lupulus]|uniref:organ-specific protein P4-like n=1 Tax=Humulus lupulus TaxID=3486 RepID=UPI002B417EE8|nr:organ-specific protein P4-like [Humulus lupulus]
MRISRAIILALLSLFLIVSYTESRSEPGAGEYWRKVMKDEPMPEAIHGLMASSSSSQAVGPQDQKTKCNENNHKDVFTDNFEPTPNLSAYPDQDTTTAENKAYTEDFKPKKNEISIYSD